MTTSSLPIGKVLIASAAMAIGFAVFATSAGAEPWRSATWGRGWATKAHHASHVESAHGQTQDIKTDGYCVYARIRHTGESWPGTTIPNSRSCGNVVSFEYWTAPFQGVRLYRDDGRYLTLYGN